MEIDYTNWRGERDVRWIVPKDFYWGSNEWHPQPQWLVLAYDLGKSAWRTFAMQNIHSWRS